MGPGEGLIGEGPRWGRLWYSAGAVAEGVTQACQDSTSLLLRRRRHSPPGAQGGRQRSEDEREKTVCEGESRLRGKTTFSGLKKTLRGRSGAELVSRRVCMGLGAGRGAPRSVHLTRTRNVRMCILHVQCRRYMYVPSTCQCTGNVWRTEFASGRH